MIEHIIENFNLFNFKNFNLVNHQAELNRSYFNSLKRKYKINFTKEKKKPLGTVGGLSLIKKRLSKTLFYQIVTLYLKLIFRNFMNITSQVKIKLL